MKQKDKIKATVAIILVAIIILSVLLFGKESVAMKYVSGSSLVVWVITMVVLNRKNHQ